MSTHSAPPTPVKKECFKEPADVTTRHSGRKDSETGLLQLFEAPRFHRLLHELAFNIRGCWWMHSCVRCACHIEMQSGSNARLLHPGAQKFEPPPLHRVSSCCARTSMRAPPCMRSEPQPRCPAESSCTSTWTASSALRCCQGAAQLSSHVAGHRPSQQPGRRERAVHGVPGLFWSTCTL